MVIAIIKMKKLI